MPVNTFRNAPKTSVFLLPNLSAWVVRYRDIIISPNAIKLCRYPMFNYLSPFFIRKSRKITDKAPYENILNILAKKSKMVSFIF